MSHLKPNPPGVMEKNNKTMMEIDKHNKSWNGKKYAYPSKTKALLKKMK